MHSGKGGRVLRTRHLVALRGTRSRWVPAPSQCPGFTRAIVVAVLTAASTFALAQTPPIPPGVLQKIRPDAGTILEQNTREPLRLPPPTEEDVRPKVPEPRPALPVSPTLKVAVARFTFSGNTLYNDEQLGEVVQEFVGKELDFEALNDAATKVRAFHRERGYFLAQAYLPQQAIREGVVEIAVIEGRIGTVELQRRPATRLAEWLLAGILGQHMTTGDIITETSLEKPLLLINDLPTASVTSEIRPSDTPGAADLRVNVDQGVGMFNGFIDFDNQGSRFTGEYRLGASLNLNNPSTIGDQLTFRYFETDESMWFWRAAYLVPAGFWGTRVGAAISKFDYALAKDFAPLLASGEGVVKSVFAFHPIYRTRNSNIIVQLAYEEKELQDRVQSTNQEENRLIEAGKLGVVGDFRDRFLGGGLNAFSATYTHGELTLQPAALAAADSGTTGLKTAGTFRKWNFDFKRLNRINEDTSVLFSISGQQAVKNLTSAEKFGLGGASGVRAYPTGEASGDNGLIMQLEGRYIFPGVKFLEGDVSMTLFYDWGQVEVNDKPLPTETHNRRSISGYGVGVSLGKEGDFVMRASASYPWDNEPLQADSAKRDPRIWVQAVKWF
jgi:hemolysin activation/secretion protein